MPLVWRLPAWLAAERHVLNATQLQSLIREKTGQTLSLPTVSAIFSGDIAALRLSTIQTIIDALGCNLSTFCDVTPSEGATAAAVTVETAARRRGGEAFFARNYATAARHLSRHIEAHPDDFVARLMLAESLLLNAKHQAALNHCAEVACKYKNNARAHYLLGRCLLAEGRGAEAAKALQTAAALGGDPDERKYVLTALAQALSLAGKHDAALECIRMVLKAHPNSVKVNYTMIQIMKAAEEPQSKVEAHLRHLAARRPQLHLQLEALERNPGLVAAVD